MEFYDRNGKVVCYVTDNGRVYSWSGKPLGTVHNERIFRLSGQLVGWIKRGFLMGETGECLLFTAEASTSAGPVLPTRQSRPTKAPKQPFPEIGSRAHVPSIPTMVQNWGANPFWP